MMGHDQDRQYGQLSKITAALVHIGRLLEPIAEVAKFALVELKKEAKKDAAEEADNG